MMRNNVSMQEIWRSIVLPKREIYFHTAMSITSILCLEDFVHIDYASNDLIHCPRVRDSKIILQEGVLWSHGFHMRESREVAGIRDSCLEEIEIRWRTTRIGQWKTTVFGKQRTGSTYVDQSCDLQNISQYSSNQE